VLENKSDDTRMNDVNDEIEDDALLQKFSLEYMTNIIDFFDEIDETTGKRKHTWKC
jgi:hypothetical protein